MLPAVYAAALVATVLCAMLQCVGVRRARRYAAAAPRSVDAQPPLPDPRVDVVVDLTARRQPTALIQTAVWAALALDAACVRTIHLHVASAIEAYVLTLVKEQVVRATVRVSADPYVDDGCAWVLRIEGGCALNADALDVMKRETRFGTARVLALRSRDPGVGWAESVASYVETLGVRAALLGQWRSGMGCGAELVPVGASACVLSCMRARERASARDWSQIWTALRASRRAERAVSLKYAASHALTSPVLFCVAAACVWGAAALPLAFVALNEWRAPRPAKRSRWFATPTALAALALDALVV
jgi:hypothetical protein